MPDKNIIIRPTVAQINGQLVESYERKTNASDEAIEALGLDPTGEHWAKIGVASINEFIRLKAFNLVQNSRQSWLISDLGTDVEIDSIYIDSPNADSFDLEVYDSIGNKPLDLTVRRNQAPYDLPNAILTQDLKLTIFARNYIAAVYVMCRPAVLLRDNFSIENVAAMTGETA